ncbi:MAG: thiamine phosphate synthase [Methylococcales bacterium]
MKFPNRGLYAVTQTEHKAAATVIEEVEAAIVGGAAVVQYRDKSSADTSKLAYELVKVCHHHQVPLIINDNVELAAKIGADGVHLGKDDGYVQNARNHLGADAIIGVSCYNAIERALLAQQQGATYVAFGRFFPSGSKPLAAPAQLNTLTEARAVLSIPIVAIGGILPENGGQLLAAGADLLAVIGGLFNADPQTSAAAFQSLFSKKS